MRNKNSGKVAVIGVAAVAVFILVLLVVPGLAAEETPAPAILHDGNDSCAFFNPDPADPDIVVTPDKIILIEEKFDNGFHLFRCEVKSFPIITDSTIVIEDASIYGDCFVSANGSFDVTNNWTQVIMPNGNAYLTCRFNPSTFVQ